MVFFEGDSEGTSGRVEGRAQRHADQKGDKFAGKCGKGDARAA